MLHNRQFGQGIQPARIRDLAVGDKRFAVAGVCLFLLAVGITRYPGKSVIEVCNSAGMQRVMRRKVYHADTSSMSNIQAEGVFSNFRLLRISPQFQRKIGTQTSSNSFRIRGAWFGTVSGVAFIFNLVLLQGVNAGASAIETPFSITWDEGEIRQERERARERESERAREREKERASPPPTRYLVSHLESRLQRCLVLYRKQLL